MLNVMSDNIIKIRYSYKIFSATAMFSIELLDEFCYYMKTNILIFKKNYDPFEHQTARFFWMQ